MRRATTYDPDRIAKRVMLELMRSTTEKRPAVTWRSILEKPRFETIGARLRRLRATEMREWSAADLRWLLDMAESRAALGYPNTAFSPRPAESEGK